MLFILARPPVLLNEVSLAVNQEINVILLCLQSLLFDLVLGYT